MNETIEPLLRLSIHDVFQTMLDVAPSFDPGANGHSPGCVVAGSIGFSGSLTGVIYLTFGADFASDVTRKLLSLEKHEPAPEEMVNDSIGEITNMVFGHLKSRLTPGNECVMTIPSIVRGSSFNIEHTSNTEVLRIRFSCGAHSVTAELLLKHAAKKS